MEDVARQVKDTTKKYYTVFDRERFKDIVAKVGVQQNPPLMDDPSRPLYPHLKEYPLYLKASTLEPSEIVNSFVKNDPIHVFFFFHPASRSKFLYDPVRRAE